MGEIRSLSRSAHLAHQLASDTLKALHDHGGRPFALLRNDIQPAVEVDLDVLSQRRIGASGV